MKLKIGMLDHMNNNFRNTVFEISVDVPLNISLICKSLANFFKSPLKMKWLDFVVGVNYGSLFSSDNYSSAGHHEQKNQYTSSQIRFLVVAIKQ